MNKISDHQNRSGEKSFEDIGAKHSSASVTGEIRGDLKVIFDAFDKFMTIRFFSSVEFLIARLSWRLQISIYGEAVEQRAATVQTISISLEAVSRVVFHSGLVSNPESRFDIPGPGSGYLVHGCNSGAGSRP